MMMMFLHFYLIVIFLYIVHFTVYIMTVSLVEWVESSLKVWETWVHSQVASYQRLLK